jgi:hypothetical protein
MEEVEANETLYASRPAPRVEARSKFNLILNLTKAAACIAVTVSLTGCDKTESYRYKLTLTLNTSEGIKRGSSVVEAQFYEVSIPAKGTAHKLVGQALFIDLGAGKPPLVALLTSRASSTYRKERSWYRDAGPSDTLLSSLYGVTLKGSVIDYIPVIAGLRGLRKLQPSDLPDLVTFTDVKQPNSVIAVDPADLQNSLGSNISWGDLTLEITDEPITQGIQENLPWLQHYYQKNLRLDGSDHGAKSELANSISWSDFDRSVTLKRKN